MSDLHDDTPLVSGSASPASGADDGPGFPAAVLWVPDPEKPHGWREFYVYPSKPGDQRPPIGYRKA